jgi:hypothetical protein
MRYIYGFKTNVDSNWLGFQLRKDKDKPAVR